MRPSKLYGKMRPGGGVEIGLRREMQEGRRFACIYIQSMGAGMPSAWMSKPEARKLIRWLERFLEEKAK